MKKLVNYFSKNTKTTITAFIVGLVMSIIGFKNNDDELLMQGIITIISGVFVPDPATIVKLIKSVKSK